MSQVVALAERTRHPGQGAITAAAALGRGAALVLGWHRDRLPRRGIAAAGEGASRGPFRLTAWAHEEAGLCWFLAAVQLQGPLPEAAATLMLHAPGMPDRPLGAWPSELEGARELTDQLAARCRARPGDVALFIAELVEQAPRGAVLRSVLRRFLAIASTEDGAVEIIGRHGTTLLLQGWGSREADVQAVFADGPAVRAPVTVATFARADIRPPATGLLEALALPAPWDAGAPAVVHLAANGRLLRRPVVASPQVLGAPETAGHLAAMLPRLEAEPAALALLGRAARPPYEGVETVSRARSPLAAALDLVALLPGVGAYVAGWLVDPSASVTSVSLATTGGFSARLDDVWSRIARPDVAAGLASDRRFASLTGDLHGFAAFVAGATPEDAEGLHVALELDGGVAYLPAQASSGTPRALLARIAASIDLHKPTGLAAVEAQLSPLLSAATAIDALPGFALVRSPQQARTALLLPLPEPAAPSAALLSPFLHDPPAGPEEALVLVLGPAWRGAPMADLLAVLDLYGLVAGVAVADTPPSIAEAWEIGARATASPLLHCLPAAGHQAQPGWRRALAAALASDGEAAVAMPTLLYEDGSVRSTGFDGLVAEQGPPYVRLRRPFAGMPGSAVRAPGCLRRGGLLAGALMTREAHRRGGGFCRFGLRTQAQEAGFFLRLGDAGGTCRWVSEVALVAPEAREQAGPGAEAIRLAEGHALRGLWCSPGR